MSVYIPPYAKAMLALEMLHDIINKQLTAHPSCMIKVAGDFNHADLKRIVPKFSHQKKQLTNNEPDQVYAHIQGAFKAASSPHLCRFCNHTGLLRCSPTRSSGLTAR